MTLSTRHAFATLALIGGCAALQGCSGGGGTPSSPSGSRPGPPCGLTYTPSNTAPVLSWRAPRDCNAMTGGDPPTSYLIEVGNNPGETLATITTSDAATTHRATNGGPLDGRGYVRVKARNQFGTSGASEEIRYDNHGL